MSAAGAEGADAGAEAQELLSRLVRFNTVNPPGDVGSGEPFDTSSATSASISPVCTFFSSRLKISSSLWLASFDWTRPLIFWPMICFARSSLPAVVRQNFTGSTMRHAA